MMSLLMIAVSCYSEGLAVGVGFGAIGKTPLATYERAWSVCGAVLIVMHSGNHSNLALGIGIQNFPEGLAVSLPLRAAGMGPWISFWSAVLS